VKAAEAPKPEKAKPAQVAKAEVAPAKVERAAAIAPIQAPAPEVTQTASLPAAPAQKASLGYRWPARGRVISGFGGNGNEGINIAVPEGTPVKAAEDGTSAYAGSEVKGYGKLVLIRTTTATSRPTPTTPISA
jgi:murein DD-endopeptidase MepM/ murein hydrolase activator NlpD